MTIRSSISFPKQTNYTVNITRNYYVNRPAAPKANNGVFWGTFAAGGLMSLVQSLLSTFTPEQKPEVKPSVYKYDDYSFKPPEELGDDDIDADDDADNDTDDDGDAGARLEATIEHIPGNTTYQIVEGNTWYNITLAKYDIPEGVDILDVARELAVHNSGIDDRAEALRIQKTEGIVFYPGQTIELPDEFEINGKKITLKENPAEPNHDNTNFDNDGTYTVARVTSVGDKWQVLVNGETRGTYDTQQKAEQAKAYFNEKQTLDGFTQT